MKSIRTPLSKHDKDLFRNFLDIVGLQEVIIGDYEDIDHTWYKKSCLCYAYSEKSNETVAILTHITLKYGSVYNAYKHFINAMYTSSINDPYFNWTP